jgi:hypothetical protein
VFTTRGAQGFAVALVFAACTAPAAPAGIAATPPSSVAAATTVQTPVLPSPRATPRPTATRARDPLPTPAPAQDVGTDEVPEPSLDVMLTASANEVHPGELVSVTAKTATGVTCVLATTYQFMEPVDLGSKVTNQKGVATWTWVVAPDGKSEAVYVTGECEDGDQWGIAQVDIPIEQVACEGAVGSGRVSVDGTLSSGEWDDASAFGPLAVEIGRNLLTATVYVRPDPRDLVIGVRFDRDLSNLAVHTVAVRLDATPVDGSWNAGGTGNGDDGFVANLLQGWFFDEHFSTAVYPNQGQSDDEYGSTKDGSMATGYHGTTTVVEMSHPFHSGDIRDVSLAAGERFGLSLWTYLKDAGGHEARVNLVPWYRSDPMQWVACDVPAP